MGINLEQIQNFFRENLTIPFFMSIFSLIGIILIIYVFFKIVIKSLKKFTEHRVSPAIQNLITKILQYTCLAVILLTIFKKMGINISAFVGAAGIAGVAIGFAAQTSVSNIISGFFVLAEKAFKVGDRIQLADITGNVESIDFMAIRVKTLDGNIVRIPNEVVIKGNLINYSSLPIRRVETKVSVAYGTDMEKAESILMDIPNRIPQILKDPEPFMVWTAYANSGIEITFYAWGLNEDFLIIKNSVFKLIAELFEQADITIPFPQMDVYINPYSKGAK
ncbi:MULTISPECIES: mechanosensitive ion channel family protein [unclassified Treponema]|uniref:mechanosensitive ion channel family protein n=1 Tax=unclassified Treponema TaxID=2638727 RepID=UPI0020A4F9AE|nr:MULTISPECIES: mechanosensitive ion channel family protein [unclassified Treponema]UTC66072.1 mechanosensitive ion channel family protein [Treponema sp. OMZ 789]UTC68802.1 mechanosensitive ion channel family protein [Treponema sp. OMZ 790]UTC71530.1 mechanosensitive ion channel family protein [Treponema sp. OMZ 791]